MIPALSRMKNNDPINRIARGDNFLFKNIKNFKIHKKFTELGRFEVRISYETIDLMDFH